MMLLPNPMPSPRVWQVGALCRAIADALQTHFNPVTVCGELSGFSRATSGHCYFSLKDPTGQLRCAMFKRAAGGLDFAPRDGDLVEVIGKLGVYEPRGDLQLIVERMSPAGQGKLLEDFLRLKAQLQVQGLFDAARKRPLPMMPRAIGLVTSLGAAALHDVLSALQRRVPHIPVILAPAAVQGTHAPQELISSLSKLYLLTQDRQALQPDLTEAFGKQAGAPVIIDVILLVRGGGAMEDLWAFNDASLAHVMTQSPVPIVCGVGHETDFTIADFVADLRAPTPTAAAELVAQPRDVWLGALDVTGRRLADKVLWQIDRHGQRLDRLATRLGRPLARLATQRLQLAATAHQLQTVSNRFFQTKNQQLLQFQKQTPIALRRGLQTQAQRLDRASLRLDLLDPQLVLERGYAWLSDAQGQTLASVRQVLPGLALTATLSDGTVDLCVPAPPG